MLYTLYIFILISSYISVYLFDIPLSFLLSVIAVQASLTIIFNKLNHFTLFVLVVQSMLLVPHRMGEEGNVLPLAIDSISFIECEALFDSSVSERGNTVVTVSMTSVTDDHQTTGRCSADAVALIDDARFIPYGTDLVLKGRVIEDSKGELFIFADRILETNQRSHIVKRVAILTFFQSRLSSLSADEKDMVSLLALGVKGQGSSNITRSAVDCGIAHLFALSGMHLQVILMLVMLLLDRIFPKKTARFFSGMFAMAFTFVAGNKPSLVRAVIALLVRELPLEMSAKRSFLLTFCIHSLLFPSHMDTLAALYSYSAVASIILLSPLCQMQLDAIFPSFLSTPVSLSVSAMMGTSVISMRQFAAFHPTGIVFSVLITPLIFILLITSLLYIVFNAAIFQSVIEFLNSHLLTLMEKGSSIPQLDPLYSFGLFISLLLTFLILLWYCSWKAQHRSVHHYEMGFSLRFTFTDHRTA
ncbi:MAG: ComEC/Rec2 family competence protein [Sphaerochaetaceae bacterium]|nr:ComEC/Rec2 family competence protein [Sphaerochaetaceae bacterium]